MSSRIQIFLSAWIKWGADVHPMFRGYKPHDTQEFLRCFMNQLHEELKEPFIGSFPDRYKNIQNQEESQQLVHGSFDEGSDDEDNVNGGHSSPSQGEYGTCDSGVSERCSLSDEGERGKAANKRKLSRSPSPPQERMRSKLTTPSSKTHGSSPSSPTCPNRKKQPMKYRSIISDVFDGKVLSSVQCLTCDRMAVTFARRLERLAFRFVEFVFGALFRLLYRGPGEQVPPISNLLLLDSATTLAHKIRTKKVTSVEVVEAFIARIREVNLVLNTVVDERFEEALKEAKAADERIRSGTHTPEELEQNLPFLGVPFTTKDCVQVKGLRHTAGLYKRRNLVATEDADCVAQMRAAGAFPLAVTNVSELCMWWESNNTIYGRTRNPYNTNRIVGGSSGGEGCLQAAAGSPMGIGTDIGGSIRMPAFFNGIFGHKPSRGVVSNAGQYPIPNGEQNTFLGTGPMTRFATDLLPIFRVLAGPAASERLGLKGPPPDLRKIKVFYAEDDGGGRLISAVQPDQRAAIKRAVNHLEKALGIKAKKINLPRLKKALPIWFAKMQIKDAPTFAQQLDNCEGTVNIFLELVKWALFMSKHTFIGLFTAIMEKNGVQAGSETHTLLLNECVRLRQDFQDILGDDGVFLYPTHPTVAPFHNEPALKPYNFAYTGIFNVLGFPATQCPLGLGSEGLPLGLQVIANLNQDRLTLAMACELEKAFGGWVPPAIAV